MRRPIIIITFAFAAGLVFQYYTKASGLVLGSILTVVCFFILWNTIKQCQQQFIILIGYALLLFFIGCFFMLVAENKKSKLEGYEGEFHTIYGRVLSVQQKDRKFSKLIIKTVQDDTVLVSMSGELKSPSSYGIVDYVGRNVRISGTVQMPVANRNPKGFNYKLYLKTRNIQTLMTAKSNQIQVIPYRINQFSELNIITNSLVRFKYKYLSKLMQNMSPDAYGMMVGILFGDKILLDENTYEEFQRNGVAHILSVSGIHVGIVYLYINKILGNRRTVFTGVISFLMLFTYGALSEFAPSVIRSVVMISIHILSKYIFRRYDLLTCTCGSCFGMLLFNPYFIFNVGFQLSYLAVFCLAVLFPWINRRIDFWGEGNCPQVILKSLYYLAPLFAIQIGMTPYSIYCSNYFSIASLILNIPIIAISGLILPIGMLLIPLSWATFFYFFKIPLGQMIFGVGATLCEVLIDGMVWLNHLFYYPGVSYINLISPSEWMVISYYGLFFFVFSEWFRVLYQRKMKTIIYRVILFIIGFSLLLPCILFEDYSKVGISFIDVGQGDCLLLRTPKGKSILIDGGGSLNYDVGKKVLLPYLLKNQVSHIDLALVTHLHDDHFLGIASLSKEMKIDQFGMYEINRYREQDILKKTGLKKDTMLYLVQGQRIPIEHGIWIDILYPLKKTEEEYKALLGEEDADENESSLLIKVHYLGLEILMTGDLGFSGEDAVIALYDKETVYGTSKSNLYESHENFTLESDILKIGHHGSKYSTSDSFLNEVSPRIAVFQVGKNNFGHPNQGIIEKCIEKGIMVYRNDKNGAILLEKGNEWRIKTMLPQSMLTKESAES